MTATDTLTDQIIGERFHLEQRLGTGGVAVVYKAEDAITGQSAAVKILPDTSARGDKRLGEELRRRFHLEAEFLRRLAGVSVVPQYLAHGDSPDGSMWIAMEYIGGRSLRRVVQRLGGKFTAPLLIFVAGELAGALKAIHSRRVLHRDLCPENIILVRGDSRPALKLIDFGFSKSLEAAAPSLTQQGAVLGKPEYLSPEHAAGEELTAATDIYALGVILYELVTGRYPVDVRSMAELAKIRRQPPRPLTECPAAQAVPEELRMLIMSCLAKAPYERPTLDELLECCRELEQRHASGEHLGAAFSIWELTQTRPGEDGAKPTLLRKHSRFGPFQVRVPLGAGVGGEVWLAFDARTGTEIVLRVLPSDHPRAARLVRAARTAARFDHPNVMRVYDVGETDELVYSAMRYVRGNTLAAEIEAEPGGMSPARFLQIAAGLLAAAAEIHAVAGEAHGAIHPGNVFLDAFDNVILADFGTGRDAGEIDATESAGEAAIATAPELAAGGTPDVRSDIYAVGCCLYAMATGTAPFTGPAMRVLFRHCHDTPWPVLIRRPDLVPQALSWIIERCLAKNPLARPDSFDVLKSWIDHAFADPAWNPAREAKTSRGFDAAGFFRLRSRRIGDVPT